MDGIQGDMTLSSSFRPQGGWAIDAEEVMAHSPAAAYWMSLQQRDLRLFDAESGLVRPAAVGDRERKKKGRAEMRKCRRNQSGAKSVSFFLMHSSGQRE